MEVNKELLNSITSRASVIDPKFAPLMADTEMGNRDISVIFQSNKMYN